MIKQGFHDSMFVESIIREECPVNRPPTRIERLGIHERILEV